MNSKYLIEKLFSYSLKAKLTIIIVLLIAAFGVVGVTYNSLSKTTSIKKTTEVKGEVGNVSPIPTLQENKVIVSNTITAIGVYNYLGAKTSISIQFPESGGRVTGNTTDECNGSITGVYDGKESINGNATGTCRIFNNNLPSKASYGGIVYKDQKKIVINFQGASESYSHKGTVALYFR